MVLGTPVHRHHACCWSALERALPLRHLRPGARRRPGAVPAPVLVLLAPGGLHHDPAGDGRRSASWSPRSAASRSSATRSSRSPAWRSRCSASWSGATTCSSPASRSTPALIFSILSFLVAIPSAVKVFNWTATMYKGSISWETPMLYAIGFIGLFTIGGLTGLFLAAVGLDVHVHRHLLHRRALPLHHGRRHDHGLPRRPALLVAEDHRPASINELLAKISAAIIFVGFNLTFFPQFILGYLGHAAPLSRVSAGVPGAERAVVGRRLDPRRRLPAADDLPDLVAALRHASPGSNPWGAVGLEWKTTSPPPTENFAETPIVTWDAYDYPTPVEGHVA